MPATLMQPPPTPCTTRMTMMEASVSQKPNPTVPPPRRTRPAHCVYTMDRVVVRGPTESFAFWASTCTQRTDHVDEHAPEARRGHAGHERGQEEAQGIEREDDADDGGVRAEVLLGPVREEGHHRGCRRRRRRCV